MWLTGLRYLDEILDNISLFCNMAITTNIKLAKKLGLFFTPIFLFYNFHSDHGSIISYEDTSISENFISDNHIRADRNKSAPDQIEDSTLKKMNNSIKVTKN